jgi:2-methylaconitate cis-trans-isomerase PrpF
MTFALDSDLHAVPCILMRGGTSRGPFFLEADLPAEVAARDRALLAAMGSPDPRQIDGLGGAHPLTSKVGIVARDTSGQADLAFTFAQLQPNTDTVDTTPNCGNMLAAVVPFAIETGLLTPGAETTRARVLTRNTGMLCDITVPTPGGKPRYAGDARIDGVPGTAAPIVIDFLDTAGSVCSALLPTGRAIDTLSIDDPATGHTRTIEATLIDNGMPMVLLRAADLGRTAYETVAELNADTPLKQTLEALRLAWPPATAWAWATSPTGATPRCACSHRHATTATSPRAASSRACAMRRSACWPPSRSARPACCRAPLPAALPRWPASAPSTPSASNTRPANSPSSWRPTLPNQTASPAARWCAPRAPSCAAKC